jgi:hypothetical protein
MEFYLHLLVYTKIPIKFENEKFFSFLVLIEKLLTFYPGGGD